jgi:hypothetical protein
MDNRKGNIKNSAESPCTFLIFEILKYIFNGCEIILAIALTYLVV